MRDPVRSRARKPEKGRTEQANAGRDNGPGTGAEELTERVRSLAESVLARHDAELVELAVLRGRTQLVRIVADRAGGIDLDNIKVPFFYTYGGFQEDFLAKIPEVQEVHHVAGEDCLLVKVRTTDTDALGKLLRDRLGRIPTIVTTRTTIVLGTVKESSQLPLPLSSDASERGAEEPVRV